MLSLMKYIKNLFETDSNNLNVLYYLWKRNKWMLDPKSYFNHFASVPIKKPIFLIGNQGAGLTLFSRILRRNSNVINVTGDSTYWAGADEMMNVMEPILTPELSGIFLNPPKHGVFSSPRSWSYACDDLIDAYRKTENDANSYQKKKLRNAIGVALTKNGKHIKNSRFIDKSQIFSVKISFINELLSDTNPFFIHMTRNPYASIYRAAKGKAKDMKRYSKFLNMDQRIKICIQHWINVIKSIQEDQKKVDNFLHIRFEDLLEKPEKITKKACNFTGLEYCKDMIPQPYHKFPFGVRFKKRWYPLKPEVNKQYLNEIDEKYIKWIKDRCGKIAQNYGYKIP